MKPKYLHHKRILPLLSLLLAALFLLGCAKNAAVESQSFDFSLLSGDGLPLGWSVVSYENKYRAACENGAVTLSTEIRDDVRLTHTVDVAGGKKYILSAEVRTENVTGGEGANLSIDNYSVDGSYIYSEGMFGSSDWTHLELAFETDRKQDSVTIALRLGGYSNVSSGSVSFRSVSLVQSDQASGGYRKLVIRSTQQRNEDKSDEEYEAFFSLILWATVLSAAFLLFGVYRRRNEWMLRETDDITVRVRFAVLVLIGLLIRLLLCKVFKGHATDMGCWVAWGNQIADGGFATFYDGTWYDYPPLYMLILGGLTHIMRLLRVSEWGSETLRLFWYMLPAFLCDVGCGVMILRFSREQKLPDGAGLVLAGLMVLNPAAMYLSGAWAQIDSILTLFLLLTYDAFRKERRILAGLFYAAAVLIKWQALIYGPVLALVYILSIISEQDGKQRTRKIVSTAIAVALALAVIFAVSIPFRGTMEALWIVRRFLSASEGYDYATVEGYNFFALLGANWRGANLDLYDGEAFLDALVTTLNALGKLLTLILTATLGIAAWKEIRDRKGLLASMMIGYASVAFLTLFVLLAAISVFLSKISDPERFFAIISGIVAVLGYLGWMLLSSDYGRNLKQFWEENGAARIGGRIAILASIACLFPFLLRTLLRLFGVSLSYKAYGTLMIVLAGLGAVWMLWRYAEQGRLTERDPELLYLVSAMFMLWVFTFGQYMHERYVFPVLFLLLFAYAVSRDQRILLSALLLTVSTFLNEAIAMYVVSDGAIHAIRGGETHNLFLSVCASIEVASALYLTDAVLERFGLWKGGRDA